MNESRPQPFSKPQPLRLNIQCSLTVESADEAGALYEEIATFILGVQPTAIIGGSIMKLLGPCCPEKKP
jgi:hypothetical protein